MNNVDIQQWLAVIYNETVKAVKYRRGVKKKTHLQKSVCDGNVMFICKAAENY